MIKICHFTSVHETTDVRIFHKECTSLAKNGYDVYLVGKGASREENGVHVIGVGNFSGSRIKRMTKFTKLVYKTALSVDADIYHFHDPELLPYAKKLKKLGKTVIYDSHENTGDFILDKEYIPSIFKKLIHKLYVSYETSVCKKVDFIVTVTPDLFEYFKKINRTEMITNYPILKDEYITPSFTNKQLFFAGGIKSEWCHHIIMQALEKTPEATYTLCGPITENGYKELLESTKGWKQTNYLGKIPHNRVANELASSYIGLALAKPSKNTFGTIGTMGNTKLFEEMLAGLPVICTNFVLWKEINEKYNFGICVDPESPDEIAKAIQYLFNHPDEAKQMGQNGRRAVKEEFNWAVEEKKLIALYDILLKERN